MRKLRLLLAIAPVCCALLIPSLAKADSACVNSNLNTFILAFTPCTIGDKTFTITNDELLTNNLSSANSFSDFQITFDASNPLSPSFTIAVAPGASVMIPAGAGIGGGANEDLNLAYTVSTTNGSATISGLDTSVSGSVSGETSGIGTQVESINSLSSGSGVLFTSGLPETIACLQNGGSLLPGCVATSGAGSQGPNSISFAPVSSLTGIAIVGLVTGDTGTATFTSATFSIDEIPQTTPTPEPSSLVLLATGLLGVLGACRRTLPAQGGSKHLLMQPKFAGQEENHEEDHQSG